MLVCASMVDDAPGDFGSEAGSALHLSPALIGVPGRRHENAILPSPSCFADLLHAMNHAAGGCQHWSEGCTWHSPEQPCSGAQAHLLWAAPVLCWQWACGCASRVIGELPPDWEQASWPASRPQSHHLLPCLGPGLHHQGPCLLGQGPMHSPIASSLSNTVTHTGD